MMTKDEKAKFIETQKASINSRLGKLDDLHEKTDIAFEKAKSEEAEILKALEVIDNRIKDYQEVVNELKSLCEEYKNEFAEIEKDLKLIEQFSELENQSDEVEDNRDLSSWSVFDDALVDGYQNVKDELVSMRIRLNGTKEKCDEKFERITTEMFKTTPLYEKLDEVKAELKKADSLRKDLDILIENVKNELDYIDNFDKYSERSP